MAEGLRNLLKEGKCMIAGQDINKVVCQNEEIRMLNIGNRMKKEEKCMIAGQEINKVVCQNEEIRMLNIRNRKKKEETKEGGTGNRRILH